MSPRVRIVEHREEADLALALEIAALVRDPNHQTVLGLATGHTPLSLYRELVRLYRLDGLRFGETTTFNLDEYVGLSPEDPASFRQWMQDALFNHVDIAPHRTHILNGVSRDPEAACRAFEAEIAQAGGIDLQLLGVGLNGHVAFNEPGSGRQSRTRRVTLTETTRLANAVDFHGRRVPHEALTMGIGTIMEAKRLRIIAFGRHKAEIMAKALERPPTTEIPLTLLWEHHDVEVWLDRPSASLL